MKKKKATWEKQNENRMKNLMRKRMTSNECRRMRKEKENEDEKKEKNERKKKKVGR